MLTTESTHTSETTYENGEKIQRNMKAFVKIRDKVTAFMDRPCPQIQNPTDIIVHIDRTTICGTDLHIISGNAPVENGRILGHEGIATVVEIGNSIKKWKKGDRVLLSCITGCGECSNCEKKFYAHCSAHEGGWVLGNLIDGCQTTFVRIPHGDGSGVHALPTDINEEVMPFVSDILPTALEVGLMDGCAKEGDSIAIVGCGPVGLAAVLCAKLFKPSHVIAVDIDPFRLEVAQQLGATHLIDNNDNKAAEKIMELTGGKGVDVIIECVGYPVAWYVCQTAVKAGGHIAILGVHGHPVTLNLEIMWKRNFTVTAGLVCTHTIPMLIEKIRDGTLDPTPLITHRWKLEEMENAYEAFSNAAKHKAVKQLLTNDKWDGKY